MERGKIFGKGRGAGKKLATRLVQSGVRFDRSTGAVSVPIYQSATFIHPAPGQSTGYDYTRTGNPTRQALEEAIADLDGGAGAFAFASGMAALTAVMMLFETGDHLVFGEELYGGTFRLVEWLMAKFGLSATYADTSDTAALAAALRPKTRAVILESPSNPLLRQADITSIAALCREHRILTVVDNTLLTPYLQRPLALGADLAVYSATKYLGGHNDLLAGVVVAANDILAQKLAFIQNATGPVLAPHDCWLLLRGLKTLAIRLDKQQENALQLANWLSGHPFVERVHYPGLGGMLSFHLNKPALARQVLRRVRIISYAESLGGVESLITYPILQTHVDMPEDTRQRLGIDERLLRLSVGIEHVNDLCDDLRQAFGSRK